MKCDTCDIHRQVLENTGDPACCAWYMEHVVIMGENVDNCTLYRPIKSQISLADHQEY